MTSEEYEKRFLDKPFELLIDGIAKLVDAVKPGWYRKNRAKIEEWKLMAYALNRSPAGVIGLVIVISFLILGVIGPLIAPYKYNYFIVFEAPDAYLVPPGTSVVGKSSSRTFYFPLGTDDYGRDLLSLILQGARTSLVISLITISLGVPLGIVLGLIAGYYGGKVDELIMRVTDMFLAFPALILAIAFAAVLPQRISMMLSANPWLRDFFLWLFAIEPKEAANLGRLLSVILALVIVWWPGYVRIVRGSTLSERENLYVEASKAIGLRDRTIMTRHILPNIIGPILVYITLDFGGVILMEAGLSFLGLGAVPPIADWGRIVYDGSRYFPRAWWLILIPGVTVMLVALGWNLLGDTLRDVLDPRTRRSIEFKVKKRRGEKG